MPYDDYNPADTARSSDVETIDCISATTHGWNPSGSLLNYCISCHHQYRAKWIPSFPSANKARQWRRQLHGFYNVQAGGCSGPSA